jgi:hypothetical protein
MNWAKTILWVILAGCIAAIPDYAMGTDWTGMPLGVVAGFLTMNWCITKYGLI